MVQCLQWVTKDVKDEVSFLHCIAINHTHAGVCEAGDCLGHRCSILLSFGVLYRREKRDGFSWSVTFTYLSLEAWCIYFLIFVLCPVSVCVFSILQGGNIKTSHTRKRFEGSVWVWPVCVFVGAGIWSGICVGKKREQTGISDKCNRPDIKESESPTGCIPHREPKIRAAF